MSNIFKIYINNNNNYSKLYLFIKNKYETVASIPIPSIEELNKNVNTYSTFSKSSVYKEHFSDDLNTYDLNIMETTNGTIIFINDVINYDDSIETIKLKFIAHYNSIVNEDEKICFEELYMYGLVEHQYSSQDLFNTLTNNNKIEITHSNIIKYLANIYENENILTSLQSNGTDDTTKETYSYDDLTKITLTTFKEYIALGQSVLNKKLDYIVNPYYYINVGPSSQLSENISTNNSNLLFEYNIYNNSLNICLASDFFKLKKSTIDEESIIKLYYVFLYKNNILNSANFYSQKINLIKETTAILSNINLHNKNKFVYLLNSINNVSEELNYSNKGINYINLNINNNLDSNISLETIFKLFHSSLYYPLIKYNPGKKLENIYRIFCSSASKTNKYPLLNKSQILKYARSLGKTNTISFYLSSTEEDFTKNVDEFYIVLYESGLININLGLKQITSLELINNLILNGVNPIIKFIKNLVLSTTIDLFSTLKASTIQINSLNYGCNINIKGDLAIEPIGNSIYLLFNILNKKNNEITMRYKHVSNFNVMDSEEAFILELIKQEYSDGVILAKLQDNFKLTIENAKLKLVSVYNSLKLLTSTFNSKKLVIKNNPGFKTVFKKTSTSNLSISVDNIDAIYYLDFIPIYLDSLVKIIYNLINEEQEKNVRELTGAINLDESLEEANFKEVETSEMINRKMNALLENDETTMFEEDNNIFGLLTYDDEEDEEDEDKSEKDEDEDEDKSEEDGDESEHDGKEDSKYIQKQQQKQIEKTTKTQGKKISTINEDEENEDEENKDEENKDEDNKDEENKDEENEDDDEDEDENENDENEGEDLNEEDLKTDVKHEIKTTTSESKKPNIKADDTTVKVKEKSEKSNPILKRLINREPKLFATEKNSFFEEYSRLCNWNVKKQPVILTQEEKEYIDANHPGSYSESFEYGTQDKKYHYICPRYWSLKENTSLTQKEVHSGKYGTLITKKNKDGTYDGTIMEFTDAKHHIDEKGKYVEHVPGFLKDKHNRNGFCLPCCFNNNISKTKEQVKRRNKCLNVSTQATNSDDKLYLNYILGPDKTLEKNKLGFLPIRIQKFLQVDNEKCVTKKTPNTLKKNYQCFLRYGVETSKNQSFIACIADLYGTLVHNNTKTISINEMKTIIINAFTIDDFIKYNNGNLPHIFSSNNFNELVDNIDIESYKSSNLYSKFSTSPSSIILLKKIINSFTNFKDYLNSPNLINYTYLWDIICKSNPLLFPNGINLIILDITNEDITDNVKVLCPKQTYSTEFLDIKKQILLLIKNDENYEPIYLINDNVSYSITKFFSFINKDPFFKNFTIILYNIKNAINKCNSTIDKTVSSSYNFKPNISVTRIITILLKLKYEITYQVVDYSNKVIGLLIVDANSSIENERKSESESEELREHGFIPCYPSAISTEYPDIPYKLIDDLTEDDYNDYNNTKQLLEKIYNLSKQEIICKPLYKIDDANSIIGILTLGNQFVLISYPEINNDDELEVIQNKDYLFVDKQIVTSNTQDNERINAVNNIKLETLFYNNFKNTFKKVLNMHKHSIYKNVLKKIINTNSLIFLDKIEQIYNILKEVGSQYIIFANYDSKILNSIKELSLCLDDEECNTNYCMKTNDVCSLIVPITNLINNESNEILYYTRLADEFVRYNKFKKFIFQDNQTFSYGSTNYNILDNELLLFQSSLTLDYFTNVITNSTSNFNKTFDTLGYYNSKKLNTLKKLTIVPIPKGNINSTQKDIITILQTPKTQTELLSEKEREEREDEDEEKGEKGEMDEEGEHYDKTYVEYIEEDHELNASIQLLDKYIDKTHNCVISKNVIAEGIHTNFKTMVYQLMFDITNNVCSFQIILMLIKYHTKNDSLLILDLKNKLIQLYTKHPNIETLYYILLKNNKKSNMQKVIDGIIKMEDYITSDEYYVTFIDIYLLSKEYDLPIIFLCNTVIDISITNSTEIKYIICNINKINDDYYFLKVPSVYSRDKKHNYKLMFNSESFIFNINTDLQDSQSYKLYSNLKKHLQFYTDVLGDFINNYNIIKATNTVYKQKKFKNSVAEANAEEAQEKEAQVIEAQEKEKEAQVIEAAQEQEEKEKEGQVIEEKEAQVIEAAQEQEEKEKEGQVIEEKEAQVIEAAQVIEEKEKEEKEKEKEKEEVYVSVPNKTKKNKRCPNGERRNKVTKKCEPNKK